MTKKVAVLAVNPVNGCGLFQYLEAFFENGIAYKVFAVADSKEIKTNSGIALTADDVVANLKGHEDEYDALVFACGDAVPVFQQNADKPYNVTMLEIIKTFGGKGKIMIGHCRHDVRFYGHHQRQESSRSSIGETRHPKRRSNRQSFRSRRELLYRSG